MSKYIDNSPQAILTIAVNFVMDLEEKKGKLGKDVAYLYELITDALDSIENEN